MTEGVAAFPLSAGLRIFFIDLDKISALLGLPGIDSGYSRQNIESKSLAGKILERKGLTLRTCGLLCSSIPDLFCARIQYDAWKSSVKVVRHTLRNFL
jgi:hypothetical protein